MTLENIFLRMEISISDNGKTKRWRAMDNTLSFKLKEYTLDSLLMDFFKGLEQ